MKTIRKRRNIFALFLIIGVILTIWFSMQSISELLFILVGINITVLVFLLQQNRRLYNAGLICDNPILTVPSAIITANCGLQETEMEETILSTFGIMIGSKVYN